MAELRDYQHLALYHLAQRVTKGFHRLYITLPTGTGKGIILARFAAQRHVLGRVVVLIHRQDIAMQLAQSLQQEGLQVGLLMQGAHQWDDPVVVATPLSMQAHLQDFRAASPVPVATILIDEAHHAVPGSLYEEILLDLEHDAPPSSVVTVGFTATPYRRDSQSMLSLLPTCAFARAIPEMVQAGWLAPLTWMPVHAEYNLGTLPITEQHGESDYVEQALIHHLVQETITRQIVSQVVPHLSTRPTLVFALTIEHAEQFAALFRQHGLKAAVVSGHMRVAERKRLFDQWQAGALQVICNCTLLTEGFDFPALAALVIARPTCSPGFYVQMLGRGMRLAPGKEDCLVFDVTGHHLDASHQTILPHVIGRNLQKGDHIPTQEAQDALSPGMSLLKAQQDTEHEPSFSFLDPLGQSFYRWTAYRGTYFTMVEKDVAAILESDPTGSGLYRCRLHVMLPGQVPTDQWIAPDYLPLPQQVALVHEATKNLSSSSLGRKDAPWVHEPASEKQLAALARKNPVLAKKARTDRWTKGMTSNALAFYRLCNTLRHPPEGPEHAGSSLSPHEKK